MGSKQGDTIVRWIEEGGKSFLKKCEKDIVTCKECGSLLSKKSPLSLLTGRDTDLPNEWYNRDYDSAYPCTKCARLHWLMGKTVMTKSNEKAYLIKGKLVHKP